MNSNKDRFQRHLTASLAALSAAEEELEIAAQILSKNCALMCEDYHNLLLHKTDAINALTTLIEATTRTIPTLNPNDQKFKLN